MRAPNVFNNSENYRIPPEKIIDAINGDELVLFIGAGLSKLCELPLWSELSDSMLEECVSRGFITHEALNKIKTKDDREIITYVFLLYSKNNSEDDFYKVLKDILSVKNDNVNRAKGALNFIKLFNSGIITTNADDIIDEYCFSHSGSRVLCSPEKFISDVLDESYVLHIHGSINDPSSLVFTLPQYSRRYTDSNFQLFISDLFKNKTVLFIGYGLKELELLVHIISKSENRHFALISIKENETILMDIYKDYYNFLNIEPIFYPVLNEDYRIINNILEEWANVISSKTDIVQKKMKDVVELLSSEPNNSAIEKVKKNIHKDSLLQYHFLKNVSSSEYCPEWICSTFDVIFEDFDGNLSSIRKNIGIFTIIFEKYYKTKKLDCCAVSILNMFIANPTYESDYQSNNHFYLYFLSLLYRLPIEHLTDEMVEHLHLSPDLNWNIIHYLVGKDNNIDIWPKKYKEILFKKVMKTIEDSSVVNLSDFIVNHLEEFHKDIPETILNTTLEKIEQLLDKKKYSFAHIASKRDYSYKENLRQIIGIDASDVLIGIMKYCIEHMKTCEKIDFINKNGLKNNITKKLSIFALTIDPKINLNDINSLDELIDSRYSIVDVYLWLLSNASYFTDELDILIKIICKSDFGLGPNNDLVPRVRHMFLWNFSYYPEINELIKGFEDEILKDIESELFKTISVDVCQCLEINYPEFEGECLSDSILSLPEIIDKINTKDIISQDYIIVDEFKKHLNNISDSIFIDNFDQYTILPQLYKFEVAIHMEKVEYDSLKKLGINNVIDFLIDLISFEKDKVFNYAPLYTLNGLLEKLSDVEMNYLLSKMLKVKTDYKIQDVRWRYKNITVSYYEYFYYVLFHILYCEHNKGHTSNIEDIINNLISELSDKRNWQLRHSILRDKILFFVNTNCSKNIADKFYTVFHDIEFSIIDIMYFETIKNRFYDENICHKLSISGYAFKMLDSDLISNEKQFVETDLGKYIGTYLSNHKLNDNDRGILLNNMADADTGLMLCSCLDIINQKNDNEDNVKFILDYIELIVRSSNLENIVKNHHFLPLFVFFNNNGLTDSGFLFIQSYIKNNNYILNHNEFWNMVDAELKRGSISFVLDILKNISKQPKYFSKDEKDKITFIMNSIDEPEYKSDKIQVRNNLIKIWDYECVKKL